MKKSLFFNKKIGLVLGLIMVVAPILAFALTPPLGDIDPNPSVVCADITRNLRYGMKDNDKYTDVSMLQNFLSEQGYLKSLTTGYFGRGTFKAVQAFQASNNITKSGFVGPQTRAKIKAIDCNKDNTEVKELPNPTLPSSISIGLKKAYDEFKNGQISECKIDGKIYYSTGLNAYDGPGATFDIDGNKVGEYHGYSGAYTGIILQNCERIYTVYPNIWGSPAIDKYNLIKTDDKKPVLEKDPRFVGKGCKIASGCNGKTICTISTNPDSMPSTCDWIPKYSCVKEYSSRCEMQPTGMCDWTETPELRACIDAIKSNMNQK